MRKISPEVAKHMDNLSNEAGVISALTIDQRGLFDRSGRFRRGGTVMRLKPREILSKMS